MRPAVLHKARRAAGVVGHHARLLVTRRLVRMPVELLTDEFGFSFGPHGWNYYCALLQEHDRAPLTPLPGTSFGRFFLDDRVNAVRDLNDVLDLACPHPSFGDLPRFWLGTYPWGGLLPADIGQAGPAFGWAHDAATGAATGELWGAGRTLWYQPRDLVTLANEHEHTVALCRSIRAGYSPWKARGFPTVTMLVRADGARRAVVLDGHHRVAVLSHLGTDTIVVEVAAVIDERDLDTCHYVEKGWCTPWQALQFFDAFFRLDGSERFAGIQQGWSARHAG